MSKLVKLLVAVTLVPLFAFSINAGTLNGITLPDAAQVGNSTLLLNGMGLRTKYLVKVYVAGLYLPQKSSDANAILKGDSPKRLVMHFVRDVSKSQIADGFSEGFEKNSPDAAKTLKPDVDRFLAALDSVSDGQEMIFTYVPGAGTTLTIAGHDKLTIAGHPFSELLFSVWLGPKPPNTSLKSGLLGQ